jgi:uncharacterized phage protein (TIGR01671 family)
MKVCKYRVWHRPTKRMLPVMGLRFVSSSMIQDAPVAIQIGENEWADAKNCVLMQSLGIRDVNKVEVFESDLVRRDCSDPGCAPSHEGEVTWMDDFLDYAIVGTGEDDFYPLICPDPDEEWHIPLEVIGNVYQIPAEATPSQP